MAESFGGGLAQGLDSLLPSIRAERERKAQEKFKLDLYNDEKNTNNEVRRLATKQRALEIFGQGIAEIQRQKGKMALDILVNKHGKGSQNLALIVNEMDEQIKSTASDIKALKSKMYDYYNQTNVNNEKESKGGLDALEGGKPKEKVDFLKTDLYKGMQRELDRLEADKTALLQSKKANLEKLSAGSSEVTQKAEQIQRGFTIDDALASREGEVLKESLGLTDDDVARFKIRKGNAGALDSYVNDNTQPDYAPVSFEPQYGNDLAEQVPDSIQDNPAKRARLLEKVNNAVRNIPNDITSLSVLNNQDFADARRDQEIGGILEQGLLQVRNIGGLVKQRFLTDKATDLEIKTLDNIAKMSGSFSKEQMQKVREARGDDGATLTAQMTGDILTPDTMKSLSRLVSSRNDTYSKNQGAFSQENDPSLEITNPRQYQARERRKRKAGSILNYQNWFGESPQQKLDKERLALDALSNSYINVNNYSNTLIDPNKEYKYKPVDFSYTGK